MTTRRNFLHMTALTTFASATLPSLVKAANQHSSSSSLSSTDRGQIVLFQGDSITDGGRNRGYYYPNQGAGMGGGYVHHTVTHLLGKYPERDYKFYNRGISGNKVYEMADRWQDDCLNLRPDVLSILIGVNDYWHTLDLGYKGTVEVYEGDFRKLLDRTKKELPEVKLIIGEPYAIAGGTAIDGRWEPFHAYRHAAKKIAEDYGAVFIPYHSIFDEALKLAPASYWSPDGVHPSLAGSYLMKEGWIAGSEQ